MSSYGEPASYGRSQDAYGGYDEPDSYRHYVDSYASGHHSAESYPPDPYAAPSSPAGRAAGRASVGRATVGRATVAAPVSPPPADASPGHRYDWSRSSGRAAVPVSPSPNGTATGRASVRPPGGPGGRNGRGGPGDGRPPLAKKKRHWIRNTLLSIVAVCVMMAGGAMVWLSYYVDEVKAPDQLELKQASRIYYADGKEMAVLQEENREIIDTTDLTVVQEAVIATEDKKFWEHSGVDFFGIARAAINNLTGGETQGASTITQQYARIAGELHGQTYARKLKEAAMAYKLTQKYSKEEILDFYLNTVYFGRGAYGIEAAARAYFGIHASELNVAQAAMLAGIIRYPDDGSGLSRYDPMNENQDGEAEARWRWVLEQMREINASSLQGVNIDELEMPEVKKPSAAKPWYKGPQGPIVRHVRDELEEMGITDISTGGYRITTTIDREMQQAALRAAWRGHKDANLWDGIPKKVTSALVAIDPKTGAVRAYYGGTDGTGFDTADWNWDEDEQKWTGGRAPGSSFKIYTLVAMLREGIAFDSHWKTTPYHPEWMEDGKMVHNAGRTADNCPGGEAPDYCTLRWATQLSYNVPFAYFSERVPDGQGPVKIMEAARDAGIKRLKDDRGNVVDLAELENNVTEHFYHPIAYGQYGVSVLEHANGVATIAAGGVYNEAHFVEKVEKRNEQTGEWEVIAGEKIAGEQRITPQETAAIANVLTGVPCAMWGCAGLDNGRPVAAKTGTWESPTDDRGGNSDAWVVGFTPQIAAAVWVGRKSDQNAIRDEWGADINSSNLPAYIFRQFMNEAHAAKEYAIEQFPPEPFIGNTQHYLANGEKKKRDRDRGDRRCRGILCPPGGGDGEEQDGGDSGDDSGPGGGDGGGLGDLGDLGGLGDPGGQGGGDLGTVYRGDPGGRTVAIRDRDALVPGQPAVV